MASHARQRDQIECDCCERLATHTTANRIDGRTYYCSECAPKTARMLTDEDREEWKANP